MKRRRRHSSEFKFKVALEALRERETMAQLGSRFELAPAQISQWKKQLIDHGPEVFSIPTKKQVSKDSPSQDELYRKIGELEMRIEWLKKKGLKG